MRHRGCAVGLVALLLVPALAASSASAAVRRLTVESRQDVLGGRAFGEAGAYEKLSGVVEIALDPAAPANARIVDLARAPRDAAGRVVASANFMVLRPKAPRDRAVALLEVGNRGGKAALSYLARAFSSVDPAQAAHFGDGLPLRLGLTLVWVGWQFDVPAREGALRLNAPVATEGGQPIEGLVRCDWTVDESVATLPLGHRGHRPYPVADAQSTDNVLTERDGRTAARRVVPRGQWHFVDQDRHIAREGGFAAGKIYELVYRARDPVVSGIGLAAVRDVMSYAKYDPAAPFTARFGLVLGISQTGRFLRHFVYQGFNTDEAGRPVFDGMLVHAAGAGRGSFNHRFAQPSRDGHRFATFFYPTDLFPFSGRTQRDAETGVADGVFAHERHLPKVFFTNTGYEYWGRAASLIHTTPDAGTDVEPLANERLYHLAGGQHYVGQWPGASERAAGASYRSNPLDFQPVLRALLVRLIEWVRDGREPPPSAYPRLDARTLVPVSGVRAPAIAGLAWPRVAHEANRLDYGPRWSEGLITREPPRLGSAFPVRVPQVDGDGNEMAGVRTVELLAPLATYTPWSLRAGSLHPGELAEFTGMLVPFARDRQERERLGDPRSSIAERYRDRAHYVEIVTRGAEALRQRGLLLAEDVPFVTAEAERRFDWVTATRR